MSNKVIYIICLSLSAVGIGLYVTALVMKDDLIDPKKGAVAKLNKDVKNLQKTLSSKSNKIRLDELNKMRDTIKKYREESLKIANEIYLKRSDNLNRYFDTLGDSNEWPDSHAGEPIPQDFQFKAELKKHFIKLGQNNKAVFTEFHNSGPSIEVPKGLDDSHSFKEWENSPPPKKDILQAMRKFNITKTLIQCISNTKGSIKPKILSIKPENYVKTSSNTDFNHIEVTLKCVMIHNYSLDLVNNIITNKDLLFRITGFAMKAPTNSDAQGKSYSPDTMIVTINLKVLDIKKSIVEERTKNVKINDPK